MRKRKAVRGYHNPNDISRAKAGIAIITVYIIGVLLGYALGRMDGRVKKTYNTTYRVYYVEYEGEDPGRVIEYLDGV